MNNYLPTDYQTFIATSRYARWLDDEGRRETWGETVDRFMTQVVGPKLEGLTDRDIYFDIREAILGLEVVPSMRGLMTAGPALMRDNTCAYNCSYLAVDSARAFDEAMFILLCGTGVGFSVERQFVDRLPTIPKLSATDTIIVVEDLKEGWAKSLKQLVSILYSGEIPKWDVTKVRPAGARLKTFGGRASGPTPLVDLFHFVINKFKDAQERKLNSIECHDIMCKIGEVVVVGGVRRSAMISLSNLSDDRMRYAKSGSWWEGNTQRALANNSVCYTEKPDSETFLREWLALMESKSGERGIFNRVASDKQAAKSGRRETGWQWGTNPCSEIILRPNQFCNLSEVVVRSTDTVETLKEKVRLATILGTIQSTYTNFPYLRKVWTTNTEEERLLGVSLTGIMDNQILNGTSLETGKNLNVILKTLKEVAIETNKEWAKKLGINQSVAITCVR